MHIGIRFLSNFISKNKEIANVVRQSKELSCFTSKNNKKYNEIPKNKQRYDSPHNYICAYNRCCVSCRHYKIQDNKSVCGLFGIIDLKNNKVTFTPIEKSRKSKFMCTPFGVYFEKSKNN